MLKPGRLRWFRTARGAAGLYAAAVPGLLLLMAMEPTPDLLGNAAWILAIIGLFVFLGVYSRLHFLKSAATQGAKSSSIETDRREDMRTGFAIIGWLNLGLFVLCGLMWIFAAKAQCLIQVWILGLVVARGCG